MSIDEEISELVDFVETHTQKKVKEEREKTLKEVEGIIGEETSFIVNEVNVQELIDKKQLLSKINKIK